MTFDIYVLVHYNCHMNISKLLNDIYDLGFSDQAICNELEKIYGVKMGQSSINRFRHGAVKSTTYEKHSAIIKLHRKVCKEKLKRFCRATPAHTAKKRAKA